jgi:RNA polymerase sigma-70 factor (ECF subfamily)
VDIKTGDINLNHSRPSEIVDRDKFEALFHQYKNLVFRVAFLILDDKEEAEDVLQEVFLKVYRFYHTYDPSKGALTTWLYRITVNQCLKHRRKQKLSLLSFERFFLLFSQMPKYRAFDDEIAEHDQIHAALTRLSDPMRVVVVLRYFSELSYEEISSILGIPIGTVKSRLARAIKAMQHELWKENFV